MWTAVLVLCSSLEFDNCWAEANRTLVDSHEKCNFLLAAGIEMFEYSGLYVKDYKCIQWGTST